MNPPHLHPHDNERIDYLNTFEIDRSLGTTDLDQMLVVACKMLDVPKGLISIVKEDIVDFKSQYGFKLPKTDRKLSFCSYAIASGKEIFYIEDATQHEELKDHPFVVAKDPVIFYAGVPLKDENDLPLGTVCVIDSQPRQLTVEQQNSLVLISKMIMGHLQLHKEKVLLEKKQAVLEEKNDLLKNFAHVVSHDMKMPLASMILSSDLIRQKYQDKLEDDGFKYLASIKTAAFSMRDYIENILTHYESEQITLNTQDQFDLNSMLLHIEEMLGMHRNDIQFVIPDDNLDMNCDEAAVEQILLNLIGNSLKYNNQECMRVQITATETDEHYRISVIDNGIGIPEDKLQKVFELFSTLDQPDRNGKRGHGIGLSTVKILVGKLGGTITCKSKVDQGTTFTFTVAKSVGKS